MDESRWLMESEGSVYEHVDRWFNTKSKSTKTEAGDGELEFHRRSKTSFMHLHMRPTTATNHGKRVTKARLLKKREEYKISTQRSIENNNG